MAKASIYSIACTLLPKHQGHKKPLTSPFKPLATQKNKEEGRTQQEEPISEMLQMLSWLLGQKEQK